MRCLWLLAWVPILAMADSTALCVEMPDASDLSQFSCNRQTKVKRPYCKDMGSCAEATFHWAICNRRDFDRDDDNMPCEGVCPVVGRKR
jgi:hypothetical protein